MSVPKRFDSTSATLRKDKNPPDYPTQTLYVWTQQSAPRLTLRRVKYGYLRVFPLIDGLDVAGKALML